MKNIEISRFAACRLWKMANKQPATSKVSVENLDFKLLVGECREFCISAAWCWCCSSILRTNEWRSSWVPQVSCLTLREKASPTVYANVCTEFLTGFYNILRSYTCEWESFPELMPRGRSGDIWKTRKANNILLQQRGMLMEKAICTMSELCTISVKYASLSRCHDILKKRAI